MGVMQQLLAQSVQQSMGLGDILKRKEEEAQIYGKAVEAAAKFKAESQVAGVKSFNEALQKGMTEKIKTDKELKKQGKEEELQKKIYNINTSDTPESVDAAVKDTTVSGYGDANKVVTAANTRRSQLVRKVETNTQQEEKKVDKQEKKAEKQSDELASTYVNQIKGVVGKENSKKVTAIAKEAHAAYKSGKMTREGYSRIEAVVGSWNIRNFKKNSRQEVADALNKRMKNKR